MVRHTVSACVFALGLVSMATVAHADHNSIWGEGWANMPNDVHNTRIETLDGDTDSFVDFVRTGSGSESVNPYISDTTTAGGSDADDGNRSQRGTRGGRS